MEKREGLIVYRKRDINKAAGLTGSPECRGIAATRKLALIASILEAGKPLKEYTGEEKKEEGA